MHDHLYNNGPTGQQNQVGGMSQYMGYGPQQMMYNTAPAMPPPVEPMKFPFGHEPLPGAVQQLPPHGYAPQGWQQPPHGYAPQGWQQPPHGQQVTYAPQGYMHPTSAVAPPPPHNPHIQGHGPMLYTQTGRGGQAYAFGLNNSPRIFGGHPNLETALRLIRTQVASGAGRGLFPTVDMVRQVAYDLVAVSPANEPISRFVNEALFTTVGMEDIVTYIAQIYLYVRYINRTEHPATPQRALDYALTAMAAEYSVVKGIVPSDPSARQTNMRSLQYMWGNIGGFVMLNTFPMDWDMQDAEERKNTCGIVITNPQQVATQAVARQPPPVQQAPMGFSSQYSTTEQPPVRTGAYVPSVPKVQERTITPVRVDDSLTGREARKVAMRIVSPKVTSFR